MLTEKQQAAARVKAALAVNPNASIKDLCVEHGLSPAYYYSFVRDEKRKVGVPVPKRGGRKPKAAVPEPADLTKPGTFALTRQTAQPHPAPFAKPTAPATPPPQPTGFSKAMVIVVPTHELPNLLRETFG